MGHDISQSSSALQQDLACPACEYNLRGLQGPVVNCPECGLECDLARMIANRWAMPWFAAPGYSQVLYPVAWLSISSLLLPLFFVYEMRQAGSAVLTAFVAVIVIVVWALLLVSVRNQFEDALGIALSLISHAIFIGYVAGLVGVVWVLFGLSSRRPDVSIAFGGLGLVFAIFVFALGRRGERYIAEHCIRQHLRRVGSNQGAGVIRYHA